MREPDTRRYSSSELARVVGVSAKAIRVYERKRLLVPAAEGERYGPEDVLKLRMIMLLRRSGFSIGEIQAVLARHGEAEEPAGDVARRTSEHVSRMVGAVTARIEGLQRVRQELIATRDSLSQQCGSCTRAYGECVSCGGERLERFARLLLVKP